MQIAAVNFVFLEKTVEVDNRPDAYINYALRSLSLKGNELIIIELIYKTIDR